MMCLEGLNQNDLNNVLDYIYHGEIQIYQHDLDRFLGIAERLKLEGLIGGGEQLKDEDNGKADPTVEENFSTPHQNVLVTNSENEMQMTRKVRTEKTVLVKSSNIQSLEELDQKVKESYFRGSDGSYVCHHCAKSTKVLTNIKEHVETHFEGLEFPCTLCDTILRSRASFRVHIKTQHYS